VRWTRAAHRNWARNTSPLPERAILQETAPRRMRGQGRETETAVKPPCVRRDVQPKSDGPAAKRAREAK
jgi:hypothetical protein